MDEYGKEESRRSMFPSAFFLSAINKTQKTGGAASGFFSSTQKVSGMGECSLLSGNGVENNGNFARYSLPKAVKPKTTVIIPTNSRKSPLWEEFMRIAVIFTAILMNMEAQAEIAVIFTLVSSKEFPAVVSRFLCKQEKEAGGVLGQAPDLRLAPL